MRPTYDLEAIKAAFGSVQALAITTTALRDAASLGYDRSAIVSTIGGSTGACFTSR
ncbi:type II toxin-antitoxin system MqsR family toxin [Rhizobium oryzihabitans]|uniref:type II toxin-antitoxin system MqsR family toxin n=1 Tax=Rhizobium sp. ZX09 TaxID=2291939 RepID=UPI0031B63BCD